MLVTIFFKLSFYLFTLLFIYSFPNVFIIHMYLYMFSHVYKLVLIVGGKVGTKVVKTCDPTPLLYQIGNKIFF